MNYFQSKNFPTVRRGTNVDDVLDERAQAAEARLHSVRKAGTALRKSVENSFMTHPQRYGELEDQQGKTLEFKLAESINKEVQDLQQSHKQLKSAIGPRLKPQESENLVFPLAHVLERYANIEKIIALKLSECEREMNDSILNADSDFALLKLINEEMPSVLNQKKDIEKSIAKRNQAQKHLEKEEKNYDKLYNKLDMLQDRTDSFGDSQGSTEDIEQTRTELEQQRKIKEKTKQEVEHLDKEVLQEKDKLTTVLLTLVSRENNYAQLALELMKRKKDFYEQALEAFKVGIPEVEMQLAKSTLRPTFGEPITNHLKATKREIAYPIEMSIERMRQSGLSDEGIFRIAPKKIKFEKLKAFIDSGQDLTELTSDDGDVHLYSSLLKSYLRDLPEPLLCSGAKDGDAKRLYDLWVKAANIDDAHNRSRKFGQILRDEICPEVTKNIQYLFQFLKELATKTKDTKMDSNNIAIVLGPNLLWDCNKTTDFNQYNLQRAISSVATMIDNYSDIFTKDLTLDLAKAKNAKDIPPNPPSSSPPPLSPQIQLRKKSNVSSRESRPTLSVMDSGKSLYQNNALSKSNTNLSQFFSTSTNRRSTIFGGSNTDHNKNLGVPRDKSPKRKLSIKKLGLNVVSKLDPKNQKSKELAKSSENVSNLGGGSTPKKALAPSPPTMTAASHISKPAPLTTIPASPITPPITSGMSPTGSPTFMTQRLASPKVSTRNSVMWASNNNNNNDTKSTPPTPKLASITSASTTNKSPLATPKPLSSSSTPNTPKLASSFSATETPKLASGFASRASLPPPTTAPPLPPPTMATTASKTDNSTSPIVEEQSSL